MSINPNMTNMSQEDLQAMLLAMLQSNPDVLSDFARNNEDAQRLFKKALPAATKRSTSFLSDVWPLAFAAMAGAFDLELDDDDEDAYKAVLKVIDGQIEGTQDACTFSYVSGGREHKVRVTILSEDNNASGVLDKAIKVVSEAAAGDLADLAEKYRKRVRSGRVDEETRKEALASFDAAVKARQDGLMAEVPEPTEAVPPVVPTVG